MILSHKYKFFFLRARKVAGSSIMYALGKHCGPDDIVNSPDTAIARCNKIHGTNYKSIRRNWEQVDPPNTDLPPRIHISPSELAARFRIEWKTYAKIGAVRNPFDLVYSMWAFDMVIRPNDEHNPLLPFNDWVKRKRSYVLNSRHYDNGIARKYLGEEFWFDHATGEPIKYDYMIKYENLEEDYKKVCEAFNIPYEKLVKLNTDTRLDVESQARYRKLYDVEDKSYGGGLPIISYRKHYNQESREFVERLYAKLLKRYNYEF